MRLRWGGQQAGSPRTQWQWQAGWWELEVLARRLLRRSSTTSSVPHCQRHPGAQEIPRLFLKSQGAPQSPAGARKGWQVRGGGCQPPRGKEAKRGPSAPPPRGWQLLRARKAQGPRRGLPGEGSHREEGQQPPKFSTTQTLPQASGQLEPRRRSRLRAKPAKKLVGAEACVNIWFHRGLRANTVYPGSTQREQLWPCGAWRHQTTVAERPPAARPRPGAPQNILGPWEHPKTSSAPGDRARRRCQADPCPCGAPAKFWRRGLAAGVPLPESC